MMMSGTKRLLCAALLCAVGTGHAPAAIIGTMAPAAPLTQARIAGLPPAQQAAWQAYLKRSQDLMAADKATLAAERARNPATSGAEGPSGGGGIPLDRDPAWYASAEARRIAATVVSFQTPAGGWGKNMDRSGPPRRPGQSWVPLEVLPANAREDIVSEDPSWRYVGTIDNNATLDEMRFLARVQARQSGADSDAMRASFIKGLDYLLAAQFPNGGWPQVYPLQGGYHDAITFNDDAMAQVLDVIGKAATRQGDYAFVPADRAAAARAAFDRGIDAVLATQVRVNGRLTGWCQQHDTLTLAPVGARNFEPAALSSNESAKLLDLLMSLPSPSKEAVAAVESGAAWLRSVALRDVEWTGNDARDDGKVSGRHLVARPGAGPIWARFYALDSGEPIFGDRDRSIHDDVNELSQERRNGYSWFTTGPASTLRRYDARPASHVAAGKGT